MNTSLNRVFNFRPSNGIGGTPYRDDDLTITGDAMYIDGSDEYHKQPSVRFTGSLTQKFTKSGPELHTAEQTIFCVFRLDHITALADQPFIFNLQADQPSTLGLRLYSQDGPHELRAYCKLSNNTLVQISDPDLYLDGSTNIVAVVKTSTELLLYINGVEVAKDSAVGDLNTTEGLLGIGSHPTSGESYFGHMYDLSVFDTGLSPSEVLAVTNQLRQDFTLPVQDLGVKILDDAFSAHAKFDPLTNQNVLLYRDALDPLSIQMLTSPANDPHNWGNPQTIITMTQNVGGASWIYTGGVYRVYVDSRSFATNAIAMFEGAVLNNTITRQTDVLTKNIGSDTFVRHPDVHKITDNHIILFYDNRLNQVTSGEGDIRVVESTDGGVTFNQTESKILISPNGFSWYRTDAGSPSYLPETRQLVFAGFNSNIPDPNNRNPHQCGYANLVDGFIANVQEEPLIHNGNATTNRNVLGQPCLWRDSLGVTHLYVTDEASDNSRGLWSRSGLNFTTQTSTPTDVAKRLRDEKQYELDSRILHNTEAIRQNPNG